MQALGFVEISGVTAAVDALDIMCKAAEVEFVTWERKLGGRLVTIVVEGEVSAVQAALQAGAAAAAEVGNVKVCEVIARPHPDVMKFLTTG
jgi:microcompartment protein CcmL/EutN